jgi:phosphoribosylamine--glycine ligase
MGAYAPVSFATSKVIDDITERVLLPTLHAMRKRDMPFTGLLYAGLMMTETGPRVVEFNCRFGDPETEAVLPLLDSSLLEPMMTVARGGKLRGMSPFKWKDAHAVTTVVAAAGYPDKPVTGEEISLPTPTDSLRVYHAGTSLRDGRLFTSGGRVVAVTGLGKSFDDARTASREAASRVQFAGAQFRRDIGYREAARHAGTT